MTNSALCFLREICLIEEVCWIYLYDMSWRKNLGFNPFTPKSDFTDFTLSNARRFYSSNGDPLGVKRLMRFLLGCSLLFRHFHRRGTPLFPSKIALCSHVPTHFRKLFPFYQIRLPATPPLNFLPKKMKKNLFPCSQKLANVPLFPSIFCQCSLVPQNPWEIHVCKEF